MKFTEIIRNVVVPAATIVTVIACLILTVVLFSKGELGAGVSTLALTALIALFVIHDVKRLFSFLK